MAERDIHNLGSYSTLSEVWELFPNGGGFGDYIYLAGARVEWDEYTHSWGGESSTDGIVRPAEVFENDIDVQGSGSFRDGIEIGSYIPHTSGGAVDEFGNADFRNIDADTLRIRDVNGYISLKDVVLKYTPPFPTDIVTDVKYYEGLIKEYQKEKSSIDGRFEALISSGYLSDEVKQLLTSKKNRYDKTYSDLIAVIRASLADGKVDATERNKIAHAIDTYALALAEYLEMDESIQATYVGIEMLKDNLKAYAREMAQIEAQYPKIEANVYLVEPHKTAFQEAMSAYRTAYNGVVGAINRALADGKLTPEELAEVARYQTAYAEALGRYYEAEETARGEIDAERERQSQEYSERQWQDLKDTQEALISAGLANFTENISPISVQTMQLIAGDESLQYYFVESKLNPVRVSHSVKYDAQTKKLTAYRGIIKHYTIGQTAMTPEANRVYRFWDAPQMTSAELETGKVHWLYIKADKASESASFVVSDKAIKMEEVSGYYHLLVGLLNPERNGTRSFAPLYGYTEILPNRITVDRIVSQDGKTSFDLVKGEIKGNLSITSGGTEYRIPADRGAFVSGTTYYFNDRVSHNGSLWLCVVSQTNTAPNDTNTAWVKHVAKGDKGDKGDKGLSVSLVDVEFAVGASPTIAPSTGWNTTAPSLTDGQYLWTRTKTTYTSGNPTYTQAVNITPQTGTGVESVTEEYAISTSKTTQPTTGWSTTQPSWVQGSYIWSRVKVVYKNPSSTIYTGYSVSSEWEAVNNLEVGGRNLLLNSNFKFGKRNWLYVDTLIEDDEFGTVSKSKTSSYAGVTNKPTASLIVGKLYTLSCYAKSDVDGVKFGLAYDGNRLERGTIYDLTTKWKRYVHTIAYNGVNLNCRFYGIGVFYIANVQLEEGNMVTAYSEAPEDVQARIEQLRIDTYTDLEVTKDSINAVAGRTTTLENADEAINTRLQSAESSIKINTNNIALKASQTEVNELKTRMSTAEQKITPTAITSTVRNSSEYKGDINNLQSQITQTADSISLKVSAGEVDEKIAGIQVGGENLIQQRYINSHTPYNTKPIIDGKGTLRSTYVQASGLFTISLSNYTPKGWHTVSGVMTINGNPVTRNMYTSKRATTYEGVVGKFVVDDATGRFEISQEWGVHSSTQWIFHVNIGAVKGDVIEIREFMFQKGTKATAYAPSVEEARHQQGKIRYIRDWLNGNSENTGNHWIEIAAYDKLVANKAHGKPVSSDKNITNISRITDGKTNEVYSYAYTSATSALTSVTVDLLDWFEIDKVKVWHYYGDGRTYNNTKTEVSQDGVNWVTLFDSAREGTYPETSAGRTYPVSEEAKAKAYTDSTKNTLQTLIDQKATPQQIADAILADKRVKDTRNDNQPPSWYYTNYPRQTVQEFKLSSVIGLYDAFYSLLETEVQWNNPTGGVIRQTAYCGSATYERISNDTSAWTAWLLIANQGNLKDTGIDILNRKIVLMADNVEMRDNWGNLNAMFSSDWTKIRAEAIELSGTEASGGKTKVTVDGTLYAENANISGTITATSGSIGGFGISGSELTSNENSLAISGGSGTITLRKDGDIRLVMKPDNLATSPSNYFSGGGQKIISALNGMWTAIGDRNGSTTYIDCSDGKTYEANVPQIDLNTHVIIMSDEGNASVDIRVELTNGSKVIQLGHSFVGATKGRGGSPSTGGGVTILDGEGIDNTTIPPSKVTITGSGNWYVRVRCNEIKSSGTSISQEYRISMLSYITVNPVVNRSELGANGMMIATSATAYTYMVGDTFQVRRGNYCLRVTNTGIQKSSDGGSMWTNL